MLRTRPPKPMSRRYTPSVDRNRACSWETSPLAPPRTRDRSCKQLFMDTIRRRCVRYKIDHTVLHSWRMENGAFARFLSLDLIISLRGPESSKLFWGAQSSWCSRPYCRKMGFLLFHKQSINRPLCKKRRTQSYGQLRHSSLYNATCFWRFIRGLDRVSIWYESVKKENWIRTQRILALDIALWRVLWRVPYPRYRKIHSSRIPLQTFQKVNIRNATNSATPM